MPLPDSTIDGLPDHPRGTAGCWLRRLAVGLLVLIVLAGAAGVLGPRTADTSASGGGYDLEVEYPRVTRAGQPAPLHFSITREGGFDEPVQVALCDEFFDNVDFQSWYPTPSAETGDPESLVYEFDPPREDTLEVSLDARTAPGQFGGAEKCRIEVLDKDVPVTSVTFTTWRMP